MITAKTFLGIIALNLLLPIKFEYENCLKFRKFFSFFTFWALVSRAHIETHGMKNIALFYYLGIYMPMYLMTMGATMLHRK